MNFDSREIDFDHFERCEQALADNWDDVFAQHNGEHVAMRDGDIIDSDFEEDVLEVRLRALVRARTLDEGNCVIFHITEGLRERLVRTCLKS